MKKIFHYIILACMFLMLVACGKKDLDYTETNIKVHMEKIDGQWKVINTDDVLVGIFGGLEEFVRAPHN